MKIILASESPQRKTIFEKLEINFSIIRPDDNLEKKESALLQKSYDKNKISASGYCTSLAFHKANQISQNNPKSLIVSADTIIVYNKNILGKPKSKTEAFDFLNKLSNTNHFVYTGVCILCKDKEIKILFHDKTTVYFNKLEKEDILYYINNFNVLERAGGYGIQDWSSVFIEKIDGCFYNVVGFPLPKFYKLFKEIND